MKLMFIIAGDEYAADISEKLKEHAFMATEVQVIFCNMDRPFCCWG